MKNCSICKINIGGQREMCPLCQNPLTGEASSANWPSMKKLKREAFLYKLQLFVVLSIVIVTLGLDFLLGLHDVKHYSLIAAAWLIDFEIVIREFLKKRRVIANIISISMLHIAILLVLTGWYFGFLRLVLFLIVPVFISVTLVANFVFSLLDKSDNAMVYLLANIVGVIIPYLILLFTGRSRTLPWNICLMIGAVTFIGIVIFKGRKVILEVQKRMNF